MATDHQGREIFVLDQLGNGGEETLHGPYLGPFVQRDQHLLPKRFPDLSPPEVFALE